jgi:hypothetical protein
MGTGRKEAIMHAATGFVLAVISLVPATVRAELTAEPMVKFVVPEANALATSISLYGDTVLLGTIGAEAYVFQLEGGAWWMDRLVSPSGGGRFMEVSMFDDVALIGASPHAYLFRFNGSSWVLEKTLADDRGDIGFGHTVAVSSELAVVGTRSVDIQVFRFSGHDWSLEARLAPPARQAGEAPFGFADDIEVSADRILVSKSSTIGDGFEGVYAFRYDGNGWYPEDTITLGEADDKTVFQGDIALDGNVALIDADYDDVVHVFRFDGARWKGEAILAPPELETRQCSCLPIPTDDRELCDGGTPNFGVSVAIDGDLALIGANLDDVAGTDSGAAYLYHYDGAQWNYELVLQGEPGTSCGANFGRLVSLHENGALVRQGHAAYFFRIRER